MTCPRCQTRSDEAFSLCPECGLQLLRSISGVMKTSTVMVAVDGEQGFYRSVREVPEPLRTQLIASTRSPNSGTILIADRAGREQLTQVIARREGAAPGEIDDAMPAVAPVIEDESENRRWLGLSWKVWSAAMLACAILLVIAALFGFRW